MVNPGQFDPNTLALIASLGGGLAGKPGAQLTSSDVSRIFAPDLGALTGTYTGRTESEEDIFGRSAPYFSQIRNNPESDEIAFAITEDIAAGLPLIQTKKKLRELTNSLSKDERDDYMDLLDTLSKEYNNYNQESLKYKNRETFFSKAGLPEPDAPYDAEPLMGSVYARLAERFKPYEVDPNANKLSEEAVEAKKNAPWRPYREGETKPELDAIRKELEEKRVVDPNAKWTPYWPGETDADVRRIAQERQLQKELAASKGVKTFVPIRTGLVNQQRKEQAAEAADIQREMIAKNMLRRGAGSPMLDQLKQRLILQKVMENPGILNKLTKPGA
jgi:hypothetical protein